MKILFITSNKGKFEWSKRRFKAFKINVVQKTVDLEECRDMDVSRVALFKAKKIAKEVNEPFIVEDTGFYIKALNHFPGTHIKFILNTIGLKGILKLMKDVKDRFVDCRSALVFMDKKRKITKMFMGHDIGRIAESIRGNDNRGFCDLMKIFIPEHSNKAASEMSNKEFKFYEKKIEEKDHYTQFANWFIKKYENKKS